MQYVWQHRLWIPGQLRTTDGRRVCIVDQGVLNNGSGPDFFNAKINIDGHAWAGDVEIHVRASDWHRHGHDGNPAYDSVVLHVVGVSDCTIVRSDGELIPQIVMPCSPDFRRRYDALFNNPHDVLPCARLLPGMPQIYISDWINSLAHERLYTKSDRVLQYVQHSGGDWRNAAYITLARALGFKTNSEPFERLARSLPLRRLMKHRDSQVTVEGMLFGMAGFLDSQTANPDHYVQRMIQEYRFMAAKFGMQPPQSMGWKMSRMRPQNFPHRRLAYLAAMMADGFSAGSGALSVDSLDEARELFRIDMTGYWSRRYNFECEKAPTVRAMSDSMIDSLIINMVIPLQHAYSVVHDDGRRRERSVEMLQQIGGESNVYTRLFGQLGIKCSDAFTSQALIQLRTTYCDCRKCLYCRIGHRLLAAKVAP